MFQSAVPRDFGSVIATDALAPSTLTLGIADPLHLPSYASSAVREVAFIDGGLSDTQTLINGLKPGTAVYVLDPTGNELGQITQVLAGYQNLSAVSLFSHGSDGTVQLGSTSLNTANLMDYAGLLQSWSNALSTDADLLLYGCDVAADATGQGFVQQIAALTGADVAASMDLTGSSTLGGNWNLEFATGSIESSDFLSDWAQAAYQNVLATITVTSLADTVAVDGLVTLREAIESANGNTAVNADVAPVGAFGADTINFSVSGSITLGSQLTLTDSAKTTINGGNAITVSGNNAVRVFQVNSGATAELNGLTITGGAVGSGTGGGIQNSGGTITINNSTFSANVARFGGAIANFDGIVTVNNSTFSGNTATAGGGAIDNSSLSGTASLTVNNSTFSGNSTTGDGGAINIDSLNGDERAVLTVNNSTFSGNSATGDGGGISNFLGKFTINNSLVAGNSASGDGREINDFNPSLSTGSNNLFGYSGSSGYEALQFIPGFFLTFVTPTVGLNQILNTTLANNGGPTQTLALLPTLSLTVQANKTVTLLEDASSTALGITAPTAPNPAVNAGSNARLPANTNFDQRGTGFARIVGGTVDIGAFELQTPLPAPVISVTGLPDATKGAVYLADGTTAVTLNQGLTTAQLAGLVFKPVANANGGAGTFSYSVSNGTNTQSQTITLNITPVNDVPALTGTPATLPSGTEDAPYTITKANLLAGFTDVDSATLSVTDVKVNNVALTPNAAGDYVFNPPLNANGQFTVTYKVSDGDASTDASLNFSLAAVNDAPVLTGTAATLPAGTEDTAYTITKANLLAGFTDVDSATLSVTDVKVNNVALTPNAAGDYVFNPPLNANGQFTVTYKVSDGDASTDASLNFTLAAVNDAPALTGTAATLPAGTEDTAYTITQANLLAGFTDIDSPTLSVTDVKVNNVALTPNAAGDYVFNPPANANGQFTVTYKVSDGQASTDASLNFTLAAVNDAPTITAPTSVRVQSGGTTISGITIADVDAGTGTLTTTLSVPTGSLNLTNLNGATATGVNTGNVTLTGTLTQINAALATLRYSGSTFSGNTNLTVRVNDNGNGGSGGAKTTTQTIALQVARDLGTLGKKEIEVEGTVSSSDPVDRYQFTLTQATTKFKLELDDLSANADVYILNSTGTVVASSTNVGNRSEVLKNLSLLAGTYFIEVRQVSGNTKYELEVEAFDS